MVEDTLGDQPQLDLRGALVYQGDAQVAHRPLAVTTDGWLVEFRWETPLEGDPIYMAILACFAFHDDLLAPGYLARLAVVLDARPEVDGARVASSLSSKYQYPCRAAV